MLFSRTWTRLLALIITVAVPSAFAAPIKRKARKAPASRVTIETYPALEEEEIVLPREARLPVASSDWSEAPTLVPASVQRPIQASYETVPQEKRAQVLRRMELCKTLFLETGRAYDYRTMTTPELERELALVLGKATR
jgi:hypothetical protein